jgi:hypothetical protein
VPLRRVSYSKIVLARLSSAVLLNIEMPFGSCMLWYLSSDSLKSIKWASPAIEYFFLDYQYTTPPKRLKEIQEKSF